MRSASRCIVRGMKSSTTKERLAVALPTHGTCINGKLVDISCGVEQIVPSECYHLYVPHGTYTKSDILANNIKNGIHWNWLGDPETMSEMHKKEGGTSADDRDSIKCLPLIHSNRIGLVTAERQPPTT